MTFESFFCMNKGPVTFSAIDVSVPLHDWLNRCVWGRFIQSQNSKVKEIVDEEYRYVIHLLCIINI